MNAQAHLVAQGWAGPGHSLPSSSGSGLSRPLLVAQKQNNLGVGKKKFDLADQWWLRAFDDSLKGIKSTVDAKTESRNGEAEIRVVQTRIGGELDIVQRGGGKWAGRESLYGRFVKGEILGGTFEERDEGRTKRRKVDMEVEERAEQRHQRKAKKNAHADSRPRKAEQGFEPSEPGLLEMGQTALKSQSITTSPVLSEEVILGAAAVSKKERRRRKAEKKAFEVEQEKTFTPIASNSLELVEAGRDDFKSKEKSREAKTSRRRRKGD